MRTFRELCSDQRDILNGVQKLVESVRKYGANRSIPLVTKRTSEVKQLWNDFKINHQSLLDHPEGDDSVEYFVNSEYASTELLVQSTLKKFETYYQELITDESQRTATAQAKEAEKAKELELLAMESEKQKRDLKEKAIKESASGDIRHLSSTSQVHQSHLNGKIKLLNIRYQDLERQLTVVNTELENQHQSSFYIIKCKHLQDAWKNIQVLRDELIVEDYVDSQTNYEEYQELVESFLIQAQGRIETAPAHRVNNNPHQLIQPLKMQPLKIPQFQGEYSKWRTFHDLYRSMIHLNASLGNTQKMQYLKSNISGEASRIIAHMTISEANYETAWELLCSRYENKRLLVASSVETLMSQKEVKTESANDLKTLHDTTRECIHALNI